VIAQALSGNASTGAATEAYSGWLREWFQADARELRRMYQDLPHPPSWVREHPGSLIEQSRHDRPLPSNRA
jgi:hypothetical protein